jgi:hypothetical protein
VKSWQQVKSEIPTLVRIASEMNGRVVLLAVNENDDFVGPAIVERWLEKNPTTFKPYIAYANSTLRGKFGFHGLPTTYVIAPGGRIVGKVEGSLSEKKARELVAEAEAEEGSPRTVH